MPPKGEEQCGEYRHRRDTRLCAMAMAPIGSSHFVDGRQAIRASVYGPGTAGVPICRLAQHRSRAHNRGSVRCAEQYGLASVVGRFSNRVRLRKWDKLGCLECLHEVGKPRTLSERTFKSASKWRWGFFLYATRFYSDFRIATTFVARFHRLGGGGSYMSHLDYAGFSNTP